jgi:hypothetical protein
MEDLERLMHMLAGEFYGQKSTCGLKLGHHTEEKADRMAAQVSAKSGRELEAYPCLFCGNWHIGRKMTAEERERFTAWATTGKDPDTVTPTTPAASSDQWW